MFIFWYKTFVFCFYGNLTNGEIKLMFETKGQKWFECHGWDNDVPKLFYSHKKR